MVWCGNVVATAWKDYLRWIMIEMGVGNVVDDGVVFASRKGRLGCRRQDGAVGGRR
jgi:DNA-directed RNA polymerase subunit N (RpoN/RPB10)